MERIGRRLRVNLSKGPLVLIAWVVAGLGAPSITRPAEIPPIPDSASPQIVREFFQKDLGFSAASVTSLKIGSDGNPWLVADGRLIHKSSNGWEAVQGPGDISALLNSGSSPAGVNRPPYMLAAAGDGVWRFTGPRGEKENGSPSHVDVLVAVSNSDVLAVVNAGSEKGIWSRSGSWKKTCDLDVAAGRVQSIWQSDSRVILAATDRGVFTVAPNRAWTPVSVGPGALLIAEVSQITAFGEQHALVLSRAGVSLTDGSRGWQNFTGKNGLPIESLSCASVQGGSTWFGSEHGLVRWRNGRFSYFAGPRWLPDDHVSAIAAGPRDVWVATRGGVAHLFERSMTLAQKAEVCQRLVEDRSRRLGFVTVMHLGSPDDFEHAEQEISDNDGLWTAMYVCAESFRYASTHRPEAREQARKSMEALLRLESITGISGFPARAISDIHDPAHERRSGGHWYPSPVEKDWMWKGDTSSDEIVGHYLAFYVYSSLVADDQEKQRIRDTCRRITDHIIDHGYYLVDITGKPTTWGYWAPERLNDSRRRGDRGLHSLEILSHLKVAIDLLGDDKYRSAYRDLVGQHHYALNTIGQRFSMNGRANHSDDELAFLSYYPLLLLESDPALKAIYQASLRRTWEAVRPEACPLWNFIYGACAAEPCDCEAGVEALAAIPLDLLHWPTANAVRADLKFDSFNDRFGHRQLLQPLPWGERPMHKWNGNPYEVDGGDAREEEDPTFWLLPYWMGRFHHLIQ